MSLAQTTQQIFFCTSGSQRVYREFYVTRKFVDVILLTIHEIYK